MNYSGFALALAYLSLSGLTTATEMSPNKFKEGMQNYLKPAWEAFKQRSPVCPFYAEGTVVMYCMEQDKAMYKTKLGKAAPGDIDLGTYCPQDGYVESIDLAVQEGIKQSTGKTVIGEATMKEGKKGDFVTKQTPGMVTISRARGDYGKQPGGYYSLPRDRITEMDIHIHQDHLAPVDRAKVPAFCICEGPDGACAGVPIATLSTVKHLYSTYQREKDDEKHKGAGSSKLDYIHELTGRYDDPECGPCDAYKIDEEGKAARFTREGSSTTATPPQRPQPRPGQPQVEPKQKALRGSEAKPENPEPVRAPAAREVQNVAPLSPKAMAYEAAPQQPAKKKPIRAEPLSLDHGAKATQKTERPPKCEKYCTLTGYMKMKNACKELMSAADFKTFNDDPKTLDKTYWKEKLVELCDCQK